MKDDRGPADLERTIDDLKKKIDHYESLDKQDLIDRLTIANAQLLSCQKEVDRLNEYVQIMELQGDENKKEKGRQWDGVSRPSNDTYAKNWHDIFGKKEKSLHEELMEGYEEEKKMKHNNCYIYPKTVREAIEGKRHYNTGKEKLPSVTTILSATQDPSKAEGLKAWREKMGEENATRIVDEAAARGTAMHKILERYIGEEGYLDLTKVGLNAHNMAIRVIEQGLCNVSEYYGIECTLFYPGLYAGQTDMVGVHKGEDAIIDFKQTNKPKRKEWIGDYKLQLAAYAMAHDYMHKTTITKGVIMMCSKDNYYQEFIVEGKEFQEYKHKWLGKVSDYYEDRRKNEEAKQSS